MQIEDLGTVPVQFMQALPYVLTVVILAGFVGKAIPPKNASYELTRVPQTAYWSP